MQPPHRSPSEKTGGILNFVLFTVLFDARERANSHLVFSTCVANCENEGRFLPFQWIIASALLNFGKLFL